MHIEIDQSGKVEATRVATALAFSNHESYVVYMSAKTKRECLEYVRALHKKPEYQYTRIFCACLFLLIENHAERLDSILIDTESPGKNGLIKSMLIGYLSKFGIEHSKMRIHFGFVGKRAKVHEVAIETYRGKRKPDQVITLEDIMRVLGK